MVENEAHIWIHERGSIPRQFTEDENGAVPSLLNAVRLHPLEGRLNLGINELRDQRAARFAEFPEDHGGRLHGVEVLSTQDSADVLLKTAVLQCGLYAVKVYQGVENIDPAHPIVRVGALNQTHSPLIDHVEEALELLGAHLC